MTGTNWLLTTQINVGIGSSVDRHQAAINEIYASYTK